MKPSVVSQSIRSRSWTRRDLLRAAGLGGLGAALAPFLPRSVADGAPAPKRLIMITYGQGTDSTRWRPTGSEENFTLNYCMEPLAAYKDRLIVLDGMDVEACLHGGGRGHFGMGSLWTGVRVPPGDVRPVEKLGWPKSPSVDAIIAKKFVGVTKFPVFYWGTWPIATDGSNQGPNGISHYRASEDPINPQLNPAAAFDTLFDGVMGTDPTAGDKLRLERKSVIDSVRGELGRLRTEMPTADRDRLDAHLDSLRQLEDRLTAVTSAGCVVPQRPSDFTEEEVRTRSRLPEFTKLQFALIRHALTCDLTRVACFDWPHSEGSGSWLDDHGYREFGKVYGGSFHAVAHTMLSPYDTVQGHVVTEEDRDIAREDMANLDHWRHKMIATELLDKLPEEVRESSLLVSASEMSEGGTHSNRSVPIYLFQGSNFGAFRAGRYLRFGDHDPFKNYHDYTGGKPVNRLLVSLCHAMGLQDVQAVGNENFIDPGPLTELT